MIYLRNNITTEGCFINENKDFEVIQDVLKGNVNAFESLVKNMSE